MFAIVTLFYILSPGDLSSSSFPKDVIDKGIRDSVSIDLVYAPSIEDLSSSLLDFTVAAGSNIITLFIV